MSDRSVDDPTQPPEPTGVEGLAAPEIDAIFECVKGLTPPWYQERLEELDSPRRPLPYNYPTDVIRRVITFGYDAFWTGVDAEGEEKWVCRKKWDWIVSGAKEIAERDGTIRDAMTSLTMLTFITTRGDEAFREGYGRDWWRTIRQKIVSSEDALALMPTEAPRPNEWDKGEVP